MTRLGSLRKRVELQSPSLVSDGSGGQTAQWDSVATVWAALVPLNPLASFSARRDLRLTHRASLRRPSTPDVVAGMRLALGTRFFMIRTVTDRAEQGRWLDLLVEEGGEL